MIKSLHSCGLMLLGLFFYSTCCHGQHESPYALDLELDLPILAGGAGLGGLAFYLNSKVEPLSIEEINQLNTNDFFILDRPSFNEFDRSIARQSDFLLYGSYALPLALLANRKMRKDYLTISVMAMEVLLINNDITSIFKSTVQRVRPFAYNSEAPLDLKTTETAKLSFISGHTSNVAAMSFFTAKVISDYTENRSVKWISWSAAVALPAIVGNMRFQAGKHFATDVIAGYAVGAMVGYLIPELHKKRDRLSASLLPGFNGSGTQLNLRYSF